MTPEQILETIKTSNININSDSAVQITEKIMPYFWTELFITFIEDLLILGILGIVIYFIYKYFYQKLKNK